MNNDKILQVNIFEYSNFRTYLQDCLQKIKENNPQFSHRYLAKKLGLKTPNLILLVIQGKRNLTKTIGFKLSNFLGHSKRETQYFESMVLFLQAKNHEEKNAFFISMIQLKQNLKITKIEKNQFLLFCNWYNFVIRELITRSDFDGDLISLASRISPPIKPEQVQESIALLLQLNLIKKKGAQFVQTNSIIFSEQTIPSIALDNYFQKNAQLAYVSIDRYIPQERYMCSFTLTLSKDRFQELIKESIDYRNHALSLAEDSMLSNRIYQLNIQIFPVSKK